MVSNDAELTADPAGWRAEALDVRGPGARGRGRGDGASGEAPAADRGTLWVTDGMLCFAGRRETWAVPLGWLALPEADLSGVTRIAVRGADRAHEISFRPAQGADACAGLSAAIKQARL